MIMLMPARAVPLYREFLVEGRHLVKVGDGPASDSLLIGPDEVLAMDLDGEFYSVQAEGIVEILPRDVYPGEE